ncbi:MAG: hypothetical protein Q7T82_18510 [Armatimonadota bacterium]|nr:hypothetical protein [Armatimonadota bacterium]
MKFIAIFLLLLVCNAALADCHGDCHSDCDNKPCCHVCTHAIVSEPYMVRFAPDHQALASIHDSRIAHSPPEDIFRPPIATA